MTKSVWAIAFAATAMGFFFIASMFAWVSYMDIQELGYHHPDTYRCAEDLWFWLFLSPSLGWGLLKALVWIREKTF